MPSRTLNDAHPTLRARYKAALRLYRKRSWANKRFQVKVSCVLRTSEEQAALYAKGRTTEGRIVTYCDGYQDKSQHQHDSHGYSRAVDFYLLDRKTGKAIWRFHPAMWLFIKLCKEVGLEPGYYWKMKDSFHIQLFKHDK